MNESCGENSGVLVPLGYEIGLLFREHRLFSPDESRPKKWPQNPMEVAKKIKSAYCAMR